jgi:hypothetical protein
MAQTIVVQEQALAAAEERLRELEEREATERSGAGVFGNMFGDRSRSPRSAGSVPRVGRKEGSAPQAGSGFLAGAAQTAVAVTGGVLMGNFIADLLGVGNSDSAQAQEQNEKTAAENESQVDEAAFENDGDFGDMDV